jgi:hypothetical protein
MTAPTPDMSGREVVFTLDRGFRKPLVQRGVFALVLAGLAAAAGTALGTPMFIVAALCGLAAAGYAVTYAWQGRFRTVLTPEGVRARGYVNHFVPWPAVAGFAVRRHGAAAALADGSGESPAPPMEVFRTTRGGAERQEKRAALTARQRAGRAHERAPAEIARAGCHRLAERCRLRRQGQADGAVAPAVRPAGTHDAPPLTC